MKSHWAWSLSTRWIFYLALVTGSFWGALSWLGSRSEAFWLLVPMWALAGGPVLHVVPSPRRRPQPRILQALVPVVLVLFPLGFYFSLARLAGAKASLKEAVLAVYFFALSLERVLLYFFGASHAVEEWIVRRATGWKRIAFRATNKALLYAILLPFLLATFSLHRVKILPVSPDPSLDMAFEEVSFLSRGEPPKRLSGWFFPLERPLGTVLACHGVGANRADLLDILWLLREAGFQVLAFDFRGHGESEGHTVTYGAFERGDVLGAWDYLASRRDVDRDRVVAFGISMGASSLLLALPDLPRIRAAVVDSSFADLDSMARHQYRFLPERLAALFAGATAFFGWLETGVHTSRVSPLRALDQIDIPLFFFHGTEDTIVPSSSTEKLYAAYRGSKRLRLVEGAKHGGAAAADPFRYQKEVKEFFLEALR